MYTSYSMFNEDLQLFLTSFSSPVGSHALHSARSAYSNEAHILIKLLPGPGHDLAALIFVRTIEDNIASGGVQAFGRQFRDHPMWSRRCRSVKNPARRCVRISGSGD